MADFNVLAARQAGYKDPEIEQYLASQGWSPKAVAGLLAAPAAGTEVPYDTANVDSQGQPLPVYMASPAAAPYEPAGPNDARFQRTPLRGGNADANPADAYRGLTGLMREYSPGLADQADKGVALANKVWNDPGLQYLPGPQAVELAGQRFLNPAKLTGRRVLREAAGGPGKFGGFAQYIEKNPTAGENLFDLASAEPAIPGRPAIPRYDPTLPRRKGVNPRMVDAFNNPKVIEGLKKYIGIGTEKLPRDWYATSPLYKLFQQVWGDRAEERFVRSMGYQSATSSGMAVPDNIRTGSYFNYLDNQDLKIPKKPAPGYGSKYQDTHTSAARELRAQGTIDPYANPKRVSFTDNLVGNEDALTADRHWMRLIGILSEDPRFLKGSTKLDTGEMINPRKLFAEGKLTMEEAVKKPLYWEEVPLENEYGHAEEQFRKLARELGLTTADAQGKAWVGGGGLTGLGSPPETWMKLFSQRVQYTADRLGADPRVVLEKFVKGEIPLLEIGAVGAGGAAAAASRRGQGSPLQ
jgi:hypothetical protein